MEISVRSIKTGGRMVVGSRVKYLEKIKKTRLRDGHACQKSWLDAMSMISSLYKET